MDYKLTGMRGDQPGYSGNRMQYAVQSMLNMVKHRNLKGLEAALQCEKVKPEDLHTLLSKACSKGAASIVEMLVTHPFCFRSRSAKAW